MRPLHQLGASSARALASHAREVEWIDVRYGSFSTDLASLACRFMFGSPRRQTEAGHHRAEAREVGRLNTVVVAR